jgi:hypothetical protein
MFKVQKYSNFKKCSKLKNIQKVEEMKTENNRIKRQEKKHRPKNPRKTIPKKIKNHELGQAQKPKHAGGASKRAPADGA